MKMKMKKKREDNNLIAKETVGKKKHKRNERLPFNGEARPVADVEFTPKATASLPQTSYVDTSSVIVTRGFYTCDVR